MEGRYNLKVSEFARSLGRAVDAAEGKRLGHAQCVSHLAFQLGRQTDATPEDLRDIVLAGLLHDIGWVLLAPELVWRRPLSLWRWFDLLRERLSRRK